VLVKTRFLVYDQTRMIKLNVQDAKTHLSAHLERLERGEEDVVVICRRNQPIAELRAIPQPRTTRRPILRRDPRFQVPKSFFDPLPDAILADFEGDA
jgi:antitoxin (DNA-binding transcriptional repressor) of toxin-antitoxin stability system